MRLGQSLALFGAVVAVILTVVTGVLVLVVASTDFRSVQIDSGQTIRGDLVTTSAKVDVLGTVQGDLDARALFLRQVGTVGGDVTIVAGRSELRGRIGGSVHAYGGSISLYGEVDGNVEVFGGQVTLVEQAVIKGDLIVHGGSLILIARSHVLGDLRGEAAEVTIEGEVAGNVDISAWRFTLAPGSVIDGPVRYESRSSASIAESAAVSGPITHIDPADRIPFGSLLFWHAAAIPRYLLMLAIGALLVLLAPATMAAISDTPRIDFRSSVVNGLAVIAFGPILLATLGLFIITLPVVLFGGAFLLLAAYLSMVVVGLTFGRMVLSRAPQSRGRATGILGLAIGVTAVAVIRVLPIPFIDAGVAIVTAILGLGAMLVWAEGRHPLAKSHATRPIVSFAIGAVAGSTVVIMAVLAIVAAVTGALAAVATLSRSALFTWEVAPRRLAAAALILAGGALVIGVLAWISRSRGRSVITQR